MKSSETKGMVSKGNTLSRTSLSSGALYQRNRNPPSINEINFMRIRSKTRLLQINRAHGIMNRNSINMNKTISKTDNDKSSKMDSSIDWIDSNTDP
jgi:hypothetical protein